MPQPPFYPTWSVTHSLYQTIFHAQCHVHVHLAQDANEYGAVTFLLSQKGTDFLSHRWKDSTDYKQDAICFTKIYHSAKRLITPAHLISYLMSFQLVLIWKSNK